jgi:hypothetical protein
MHMLHRTSLLPVPVEQLGPVPIQVGDHGMMAPVGAIVKEHPRARGNADVLYVADAFAVMAKVNQLLAVNAVK